MSRGGPRPSPAGRPLRLPLPQLQRNVLPLPYELPPPPVVSVGMMGPAQLPQPQHLPMPAAEFRARGARPDLTELERPCRALFIRNVDSSVHTEALRELFEKYGELRDFFRSATKGICFVHYFDVRAALKAKSELQGHELNKRKIDVHFSLPKEDDPKNKPEPPSTVFAIARNTTKEPETKDFQDFFAAFGDIKEIRDGKQKGQQRFVEYYDVRHCQQALEKGNNTPFLGGQMGVEIARAFAPKRDAGFAPHLDDRFGPRGPIFDPMPQVPLEFMPPMARPMRPVRPFDGPSIGHGPDPYGMDMRQQEAEMERARFRSRDRLARYDEQPSRAYRGPPGGGAILPDPYMRAEPEFLMPPVRVPYDPYAQVGVFAPMRGYPSDPYAAAMSMPMPMAAAGYMNAPMTQGNAEAMKQLALLLQRPPAGYR